MDPMTAGDLSQERKKEEGQRMDDEMKRGDEAALATSADLSDDSIMTELSTQQTDFKEKQPFPPSSPLILSSSCSPDVRPVLHSSPSLGGLSSPSPIPTTSPPTLCPSPTSPFAFLPSSSNRTAWLSPLPPPPPSSLNSPSSSSTYSSFSLTLTLGARHLPPSVDPLLCLLHLSPSESLIGHTEIQRQSMSPAWKKKITVERQRGKAGGQCIKFALFDATNIAEVKQRGVEDENLLIDEKRRRGSLLEKLKWRKSGKVKEEGGLASLIQSSEVTSDDLIGSVIVDLSIIGSSNRYLVTQRLPIRHPFDKEIDKRLQRLSAHLLVTCTPTHQFSSSSTSSSPRISPRLVSSSSLSDVSGPTCNLPFPIAYRLLCRGAVFLKFPFSSSSAKPQPRLVFFSRHPLTPSQLLLTNHPSFDHLSDKSPPNPLFPLGLLYWCAPGKKRCSASRCLPLHTITGLYEQCQTSAFTSLLIQQERAKANSLSPPTFSNTAALSFSIVSRERTLDLVADNREVRDAFIFAIHSILVDQGRLWFADNSNKNEKKEKEREEEKRKYNEKQTANTVSISFACKHMSVQSSADNQLLLILSKAAEKEVDEDEDVEGRGEIVGQSEWVELDDEMTFLTLFFLPLPDSSAPSATEYHIDLFDLSHSLIARTSFSSSLLLHPHIDIPLSLRHHVTSIDSLLTYNRSCCQMRVKPIAGPDSKKGDILDVITLLQQQPSYNPSLPYLTLSFMLRGEPSSFYPSPSYIVISTVLVYNPAIDALTLAGHELPLSSIVSVYRQLRPSSALFSAVCAVHPEKRINSKRMIVIETADENYVLELRSVISSDAWVCGIRQMMKKKGIISRAQLEVEELNWKKFGGPQQPTDEEEEEESGESKRGSIAESSPSVEVAHSVTHGGRAHSEGMEIAGEYEDEGGMSSVPWMFAHSSNAQMLSFRSDVDVEEEELHVNRGRFSFSAFDRIRDDEEWNDERLSDDVINNEVDMEDGHFRSRRARLFIEDDLESPDFHSRSSSFSSLDLPDFHLRTPSPSHLTKVEELETNDERPLPDLDSVLISNPEDVPMAPPIISDDVPCAPPMDGVPPPPPLFGLAEAEEEPAVTVKLKKLHWDAIAGGLDLSCTIFSTLDGKLDEEALEMLIRLFSAAPPAKTVEEEEEAKRSAEKRTCVVELIEARRAQNISIALRGFRLSVEDVVQAIIQCDLQILTLERLQTLLKCQPDAMEVKQVKAYKGDEASLGLAERYIRAVSGIHRCSTRLQLMLFMATFSDAHTNLSTQLEALSTACEGLRGSDRLANVMQLVLNVGNVLNGKKAKGFRLSTLDKLNTLKAHSGGFSLLDFIVDRAIRQAQSEEIKPPEAGDSSFFTDLIQVSRIHEAAKCDWNALSNDLRILSDQMLIVKREHDREEMRHPQHLPFYQLLHSFLIIAIPQLAQLNALHDSTHSLIQSTFAFFGEERTDGSLLPSVSEFFGLFERFAAHFHASEGKFWTKISIEKKKSEIAERKRKLQEEKAAKEEEEKRIQTEEGHIKYSIVEDSQCQSTLPDSATPSPIMNSDRSFSPSSPPSLLPPTHLASVPRYRAVDDSDNTAADGHLVYGGQAAKTPKAHQGMDELRKSARGGAEDLLLSKSDEKDVQHTHLNQKDIEPPSISLSSQHFSYQSM